MNNIELSFNEDSIKQKRNFKGVWIDDYIYFCSDLCWQEKILWIEIAYLSEKGKYGCQAGNDYFSKFLQISSISVSRYISHLKELGLIEKISFNGRKRSIAINKEPFLKLETRLIESIKHPNLLDESASSNRLSHSTKSSILRHRFEEVELCSTCDPDGSHTNLLNPKRIKTPPQKRIHLKNNKSSPDYIKPMTGEMAVILSWNKLPKPACPHMKFNTSVAEGVLKYITLMREGGYGKSDKDHTWSESWLDRNNIPVKDFREKKWSFREICHVIEGSLADMYKRDYMPEDKRFLPKNLTSALFNSHSGGSYFVQAYYAPPVLTGDKIPKDSYPDVTKALVEEGILDSRRMRSNDWKRYHQGIGSLGKCLEDIDWTNYGARQMFPGGRSGNLYSLVMRYVKWLKGDAPDILPPRSVLPQIHAGMIRSDFWAWQEFMKSVNLYWKRVFCSVPYEEG